MWHKQEIDESYLFHEIFSMKIIIVRKYNINLNCLTYRTCILLGRGWLQVARKAAMGAKLATVFF